MDLSAMMEFFVRAQFIWDIERTLTSEQIWRDLVLVLLIISMIPSREYLKFMGLCFFAFGMTVGVSNVIRTSFPFIPITLLPQAVADVFELDKGGIFMEILVYQTSIMVFDLVVERFLNNSPARSIVSIVVGTFLTSAFCKYDKYRLTFAFGVFMAGYAFGMNENLKQSYRDLFTREGRLEIIKHFYTKHKKSWSLKILWLLQFFYRTTETISHGTTKNDIPLQCQWTPILCISLASNTVLQYFALLLLLVHPISIVLWIVEAFLKWSASHRVDEQDRQLIDIFIWISFTFDNLTFHYRGLNLETIYQSVCSLFLRCYLFTLCLALMDCFKISMNERESKWAHIRAVMLSIFIILLAFCSCWLLRADFLSLIVTGVHTLIFLVISASMFVAYYSKWMQHDDEQLEKNVFKVQAVAGCINVGFGIISFLMGLWMVLKADHKSIGMAHVQLAFYFFCAVWIPVQEGRRIFQRIRTTRNELDRFADATEEQLENKRNEDEPCSICLLEFMSSAKITPCEHYFHYDCLAEWLYKTTNCPYCRAECVQNVLQGNGIH